MQGSEVVGFMNFLTNYTILQLPDYPKSNFIDTICVSKKYRNKGIGQRLYKYMESELPDEFSSPFITLETWSTNDVQIHLLRKLKYELILRIQSQRGWYIDLF